VVLTDTGNSLAEWKGHDPMIETMREESECGSIFSV